MLFKHLVRHSSAVQRASTRNRRKTIEIVIENATKAQVFSPGVFASHRPGVKLWADGDLSGLGLIAEDGNIDPFMYETMKGIGKDFGSTTVIYPIDPGQSRKPFSKSAPSTRSFRARSCLE